MAHEEPMWNLKMFQNDLSKVENVKIYKTIKTADNIDNCRTAPFLENSFQKHIFWPL